MSSSTYEEVLEKSGTLCYSTSGVSMLPLLHEHQDVVVINKPNGRLKKYDVALYKREDGKYILHRVLKVRKDDYVICGDNCINKEYGITDKNILGVMVEFVRFGKTYTIKNFKYKLYSHYIVDLHGIRIFMRRAKNKLKRIVKKIIKK